MANELVRFTLGQKENLSSEPIEAGKVLFAIDGDGAGGTLYLDKDSSSRIPISSQWRDITPLKSKKYNDIIATAKSHASATFHFAKITPNNGYNTLWSITYVVRCSIQGTTTGKEHSLVHIDGQRASYASYYVYNSTMNTDVRPYYYHAFRAPKEAGFTNNCPAYIGIDLYYNSSQAYNITNTTYKRNFEIDIIEAVNCTVEFLDNMTLWGSIPNNSSTNYPTDDTRFDGATQGITISGDRNSNNYDRLVLYDNNLEAGTNGIKQYSLIMQDADGRWQSLTLESGTGTTKRKNPIGFRYNEIYYYSSGTNILADVKTANATVYDVYTNSVVDLRYSTNCGTTLVADKEVYIVGEIHDDGLFYLDDTWWSITPPSTADGKVYLKVGFTYDTYRIDFNGYDPSKMYYHNGTAFVPYNRANLAEADLSGNKFASSYGNSLSFSNRVLSLLSPDGTVLDTETIGDTTYVQGTGILIDGTTINARLQPGAIKSSLSVSNPTNTANRQYPVELSNNNYLSVNVPWTNTTYTASGNGITLSSNQFALALVSTTKSSLASNSIPSTKISGRQYAVELDSNGKLSTYVPWENTQYTASNGISLSGGNFTNSGVRSIATGTTNGTISVNTNGTAANVAVKGLGNVAYISKPASATGLFLKDDGTWATPTNTTYDADQGIFLDAGIFKARLQNNSTKSSLTNNALPSSRTSGRQYAVELDNAGYLSVYVPWTDNNTTYTASGNGITKNSSNQFSLVLKSTTKSTLSSNSIPSSKTSGRQYAVELDKDGNLSTYVPWENTVYTASNGVTLSGGNFTNSGVRSIATGTTNGTISVNTNGTAADVAVYGLGTVAYTNYPTTVGTTKFLKEDGTWAVPVDSTYNADQGLFLDAGIFKAKLQNNSTKSSLTSNTLPSSRTSGKQYAVELDNAGNLSVYVPWSNTTYTASGKGITLSSNQFSLSLVSTTASSLASNTIPTTKISGRQYAVELDSNSKLSVYVPWENTQYTASNGVTLSGGNFTNSGVRSIATGTTNGTISVNTNGTAANVAVKGLGNVAYISKPSSATGLFLKDDGTWATPTNTTYDADQGLFLDAGIFKAKLQNDSTKSSLTSNTLPSSRTSGKQYAVELDNAGNLSVYVPWTDNNTTYTASGNGITKSSSNQFSLVLKSTTKSTLSSNTIPTTKTSGRQYAVELDKDGNLSTYVPWENTVYTASNGVTLSGGNFTNSGVRSVATGTTNGTISVNTNGTAANVAVKGLGNVAYISKPASATGLFLKDDGTWATPTNTTYDADQGIFLDAGIFKAKLQNNSTKSSLTSNALPSSRTSGKQYAVELDNAGNLSVYIPWSNTTYTASGNGITLSSNQFALALVSTTKSTLASNTIPSSKTSGRQYAVELDKNGKLSAYVPWENTQYTASNGITLSGGNFTNSGVRSVATGTANGTISVNTNGTAADVAVKGLGSVAYISKPSSATGLFLKDDGTWATPTNTTYNADQGVFLDAGIFKAKLVSNSTKSSLTAPTPTTGTRTSGKQYAVELDNAGYLSVYVPWTDNNTTYTASGKGITLSSNQFSLALVSTTKSTLSSNSIPSTKTTGRQYAVELDSNGKLSTYVPWENTVYTANGGITLSGNNFSLTNNSMTIAGNSVALGGSLSAATLRSSLGLSQALTFVGKATVDITDGGTQDPTISGYDFSNKKVGDVILDKNGSAEYVWTTENKWEQLGPEFTSSSATSGTAIDFVTDITFSGSTVSLLKSTVRTASTSQTGVIKIEADTTNSLISQLPTWTATPTDDTYLIRRDTAGAASYGQVKFSTIWTYIKGKADSVYATPTNITNAINNLDGTNTGSAGNGKYVSKVEQTNGVVNTTYTDFAPSITITAGTSSAAPKVNVTVNTKSGTAQSITTATTGVYGVTKLSSTSANNVENVAATPKGVWAAIDTVKHKVAQNNKTDNKEYPILLKYTNNTSLEINEVNFNANSTAANQTTINPSTGVISAGSYKVAAKVQMQYDSTTESLNFVFI